MKYSVVELSSNNSVVGRRQSLQYSIYDDPSSRPQEKGGERGKNGIYAILFA